MVDNNNKAITTTSIQEGDNDTSNKGEDFFNIGESVDSDGTIMTITNVEKSNGSAYTKPKEGKEFVIVHIKIQNKTKEQIRYDSLYFRMQNSKGQISKCKWVVDDNGNSDFLDNGKLSSNGEVEGTLSFEEPIDDNLILIYYDDIMAENALIQFKLN